MSLIDASLFGTGTGAGFAEPAAASGGVVRIPLMPGGGDLGIIERS
jgi:hypothetical protein